GRHIARRAAGELQVGGRKTHAFAALQHVYRKPRKLDSQGGAIADAAGGRRHPDAFRQEYAVQRCSGNGPAARQRSPPEDRASADRSGNDSMTSRDEIDARPEISAQLKSPIEREHHYASIVRVGVLHRRGPAVRIADVVIDAVADAGYAGRIQIIAHQRAVAVESFDRSSRATIYRRRLSLRPGVTKKRKRRLLRGKQQLAGRYARRQGNGRLLRPDGHLKERTVVSVVSLPAGCRAAGILLARRLGRRTPGKTCEQRAYVPGIPPALAKPA